MELQAFHNKPLCIAIGCIRDTNTQRLQDKTTVISIRTDLKLHTTQLKQMTKTQAHSLHYLNAHLNPQID